MIKILASLALACAVTVPAAAADRRFTVTDFDRIVVEGPFRVTVATDRAPSASASGSVNALDRISVEVQGRTLHLRPDRTGATGSSGGRAAGPVSLTVSTRDLRSATVLGAGRLSIDQASGLRVDLSVEGSGHIVAGGLATDTLVVGAIGSGRIEAAGAAREVRASIHGWAEFDGTALRVQGLNLVTDTAGRIALQVERESRITASGIGEVEIGGGGACSVRGVSADQVRCGDSD